MTNCQNHRNYSQTFRLGSRGEFRGIFISKSPQLLEEDMASGLT